MSNFLNENMISKAQDIINNMNTNDVDVLRVKKEKGLIERTEVNKKVILVEDNRQIICD